MNSKLSRPTKGAFRMLTPFQSWNASHRLNPNGISRNRIRWTLAGRMNRYPTRSLLRLQKRRQSDGLGEWSILPAEVVALVRRRAPG
jgi:hypothetical protein